MYAVRIHEDALPNDWRSTIEGICKSLKPTSYVFVYEKYNAKRAHCQGWIYTHMTQTTIRNRLKDNYGVEGNKDYSCEKIKDVEAHERYVLKGTPDELPDIVCYQDIRMHDPDWVKSQHDEYWKLYGKKRNKSKGSITDQVYDWAKAFAEPPTVDAICEQVCSVITENGKPLMMHYALGIVNAVRFKLGGGHKNNVLNELKRKAEFL